MTITQQDIDHFNQFATAKLSNGGISSMVELARQWEAQRTNGGSAADPNPLRLAPGLGKGCITIVSEDDSHLDDFSEYMP